MSSGYDIAADIRGRLTALLGEEEHLEGHVWASQSRGRFRAPRTYLVGVTARRVLFCEIVSGARRLEFARPPVAVTGRQIADLHAGDALWRPGTTPSTAAGRATLRVETTTGHILALVIAEGDGPLGLDDPDDQRAGFAALAGWIQRYAPKM